MDWQQIVADWWRVWGSGVGFGLAMSMVIHAGFGWVFRPISEFLRSLR